MAHDLGRGRMDAEEFGGEGEGFAVVEIDLDLAILAAHAQFFRERPMGMAMTVVLMRMGMAVILMRMRMTMILMRVGMSVVIMRVIMAVSGLMIVTMSVFMVIARRHRLLRVS